ncbi:MAG TPA: phage tail spike protein, partial [Mesotoga infera]|nr:phage tail spike protein [Mesotoga infera]
MTLSDLKTLGFITTIVEGADDLNYQLNIETRREDESTLKEQVLSSYLLPRQIKLKGIVKGSSSADLISKLSTLQSTLSSGIVSLEYEGGTISCYLDGGVSWKKIGPEFGTLIAECEISLREIGTADSSPVARTLKHYRGAEYQSTLKPISGHIRETFMGRKELELTLENQDIRNLDVIRVDDGVTVEYYVVQIPEPERRDNSQFITITAEHAFYGFGNRMFLDNSTEEEVFEYFGIDLSTLLGYLFTGSGVSKDTTNLDAGTLSEVQEISFSSQTRLNALQAICEKWGIEYKFSADGLTCYIGEKGSLGDTTGAVIEYSKNLKGIKKRIDTRGLVTRLRPVGSSENLPTWYVYQNLRITTLVPNGTGGYDHSGDLYIDKNTATYGIIERRMDFDVKVQAKHGTVTGTGTGAIEGYDGEYPYIVDSARTEATGALDGGTLHVADGPDVGEAKILYYDGTTKRIYYRIDKEENFDFTPEVGAFYKITDIELTYQEINEAAATLLAKAQDYLNTASEPQVSYEVDFAQLWERDKISYSTDYFEVGDMITVKDTDLGINDSLRVISKEIDVVRPWNVKIEVSNKVQQIEDIILDIIEEGNTIKKKQRILTINQKRHNDAVRALQLLKNKNFFGDDVEINGGNIKAGTIEAEAIAIGSGNRNFQLWGVSFEPNYEGLYNKFHATGGALVFYGEEDVWTLNANTVASLTDDTTYLVYVRLRKGVLDSADNAIILSSDMKEAEDATYYYYHIGFLEVGNSTTASFLATSYGWTIIHGSQIQTGTIYADYIRVGSPADTQIGAIDTKAQDALDAAQAAEEDAAAALEEVNEIISDSILKGGKEKSNLRKEWDSIAKEY